MCPLPLVLVFALWGRHAGLHLTGMATAAKLCNALRARALAEPPRARHTMPSKKQKLAEAEPEQSSESESEDEMPPRQEVEEEEDAGDGETAGKSRRSRINEKRKARQNGYRSYAELAGAGLGKRSFGNDLVQSILSSSDIRRLATFCPCVGEVHMPLAQFETHLALRDESLSTGPLAILGANVESFARKLVEEIVLRNVEANGSATITAANVKSVLRTFVGNFHGEFLAPGSLVHSAQNTPTKAFELDDEGRRVAVESETFLLPRTDEDIDKFNEERKFAKANHSKLLREKDKARELAKAERAKRASEKVAAVAVEAV